MSMLPRPAARHGGRIPAFLRVPDQPGTDIPTAPTAGVRASTPCDRVATCVSNERNMGKADRGLRAPEHVVRMTTEERTWIQ